MTKAMRTRTIGFHHLSLTP